MSVRVGGSASGLTAEAFYLLNEILEKRFGLLFPEHKQAILEARLRPRLQALHLSSYLEYYYLLQAKGEDELQRLATSVTNNETYFFRERHQFEVLFGDEGLEALKPGLVQPGKLRVLCAGCSSGEEAFTVSFYADDNRFRLGDLQLQIDAFDIDEVRLESARKGEYRARSFRDMTEQQIGRYMAAESTASNTHLVRSAYRDAVSFSHGNIIELDSFRGLQRYDVVFCRNVLIYFSEAAFRRAIDNFATVLRPGGVLFLGHSESIIGMTPRFETVQLGGRIVYRKVGT